MGVAAATLGLLAGERQASACGGEFVPPNENDSVVTDHRMILAIGPQQTTLYDEIEFKGAPASFAWVLPIKGTATVALSADVLFASLDQLTSSQVVEPPANCPPPPSCGDSFGVEGPTASGAADVDAGAARSAVTVTAQQQVGPYETVQLHSSDPNALNAWLTQHGYSIPSSVAPIVSAYVADNFDFLAMKLAPGEGVTAMQPVRVTTAGASPVLPLRMVAAGTGATTGITLWVAASGRWQPQNFPFFIITDSELAWDWNTNASNYETVRLSHEAQLGGKGWQVESSLDLNENSVTSLVQQTVEFGGQGGSSAPVGGYLPVGDGGVGAGDSGGIDAGFVDGGAPAGDGGYESAMTVEQDDFNALFVGASNGVVRFTRMRSDIAHTALTADLTLEASSDQSELSNVHNTTSQIGEPECPVYNDSCEVTGQAPRSQVIADGNPGGGGCATAATSSSSGSSAALAAFFGLIGFGAFRARRKRNPG
jgi:MYXO-CTERM domain-containing protein